MKNLLRLIIDAAKNDDMNRVIELAENQQDRFCDNNCVWTDHHKDCVRAEQKPVVEVRLVAGRKPMFLMCASPESFKDGDLLYTTPQQPVIDKSAAIRIATALGWTPPKQEQGEPVAWLCKKENGHFDVLTDKTCKKCFPVYTTPQQRKPLTDEQLLQCYLKANGLEFYKSFARAIEAAHGIKE